MLRGYLFHGSVSDLSNRTRGLAFANKLVNLKSEGGTKNKATDLIYPKE